MTVAARPVHRAGEFGFYNHNWQTISTNLSQLTLQVAPTNDAAFYRVLGQ